MERQVVLFAWLWLRLVIEVKTSSLLGTYNISADSISASGFSAGGSMAIQLHVAHSNLFMGVGALAAAPYWCGRHSVTTASINCMMWPSLVDVEALQEETRNLADIGYVDPPENMRMDRVFLFGGALDTIVNTGVIKAAESYYSEFINAENMKVLTSLQSQHGVQTRSSGGACDKLNYNFINSCGYDAAFELLNHIYGNLKSANYTESVFHNVNIRTFDQTQFIPDIFFDVTGFAEEEYIFVPDTCISGRKECRLHIVLHGCFQGKEFISDDFVRLSGYNEVAALNDIILLYPQVRRNLPANPSGCFDWWGYTGSAYASNIGYQMMAIRKMIKHISGA